MIAWRKSSHSGTQTESECVEVARLPDRTKPVIGVRDSKNPDGPVLILNTNDFRTLFDGVRQERVLGARPERRTGRWRPLSGLGRDRRV
jgi:hypothetical protein